MLVSIRNNVAYQRSQQSTMQFSLRILLGLSLYAQFSNAFQCNEDLSRWFLGYGENHADQIDVPNNQRFQICQPFNAMGVRYTDGFRLNVRGGIAAGSIYVYPRSGWKAHGSFEIRASRGQYQQTSLGLVNMRVTEVPNDTDRIARIINEAYPCLENGPFHPVVAFVATFTCMKHKDSNANRDTFQTILAINGQKIYLILNYHTLHNIKGLQFALIDRTTRNKYYFTDVRRPIMAQELLESTNGVRKGVWVFDISGTVPKRPEHCPKEANECTMTNFGSIHSFDGAFDVPPYGLRRTLAKSLYSPSDICNFVAHVRMEVHGEVRYVDFSVGSYDPNEPHSMTIFDIDRREGIIRKRGGGRAKGETVNLPFIWTEESNTVNIRRNQKGWILESQFCGYKMEYWNHGPEPEYRLTLGPDYASEIDGYCGNFDGDVKDDK